MPPGTRLGMIWERRHSRRRRREGSRTWPEQDSKTLLGMDTQKQQDREKEENGKTDYSSITTRKPGNRVLNARRKRDEGQAPECPPPKKAPRISPPARRLPQLQPPALQHRPAPLTRHCASGWVAVSSRPRIHARPGVDLCPSLPAMRAKVG